MHIQPACGTREASVGEHWLSAEFLELSSGRNLILACGAVSLDRFGG